MKLHKSQSGVYIYSYSGIIFSPQKKGKLVKFTLEKNSPKNPIQSNLYNML